MRHAKPAFVATAIGLIILAAAPPPMSAAPAGSGTQDKSRTAPVDRPKLRRPGFIFLELGTPRVAEYVEFFRDVAGYEVIRNEGGYAELESEVAQLLLIDPKLLPMGHPFHDPPPGDRRGYSVEIGLVVADLDKTFAAAKKHADWKISSGIAARPWGVRDFRVLSPDGYYLRFTE